ncbi:hypothetical protein [Negativibacillus massiliensis]|uniref:hypothetical protein n=1 Tax=Negativibacillus massiliensis TaxID=1871035 RepID=UPI003AF1EB6A
MKKVLSVALASAMVLGMGANAFAIQYSTGSSEKADWPKDFKFAGELFVTDKDGNIIEESTTELNDSEAVDFRPGDVIWMPLYADHQVVYESSYKEGEDDLAEVTSVKVAAKDFVVTDTHNNWTAYKVAGDDRFFGLDGQPADVPAGYVAVLDGGTHQGQKTYKAMKVVSANVPSTIKYDNEDRTVAANSVKYYVGASKVSASEFETAYLNGEDAYVTVTLEAKDGTKDEAGKPVDTKEFRDDYHYTGNIDKNWSINLIEDMGYAEEIVEKAELYKATTTDVASYAEYTDEIVTNGVYVKVTLKDNWKIAKSVDMKYYVYVADNAGHKTQNQVWVSGKYAPTTKTVDFTWTNDASEPAIWEAKESGTATFDFADKAFFTVKMYKGETMYLDLSTAYDKAIAGEMDAEADSFYKFDSNEANFSRTGTLMIVSDDASLVPYEIDADGNFVAVEADYVENYAVAHTNKKVNGFVFDTKQLGNYVLSTEELGEEEEVAEEPTTEEPVVEEPAVEEPVVEETNKPNPNTGAEDFVGLAVSLAVVSVAAAGALALKK